MKVRLAIVVSHPIQHFVSFYRALAADPQIDLHVIFGAKIGVTSYFDREMNTQISWNMDLLSGYSHEFLDENAEIQPSFWAMNSPHLAARLDAFNPEAVMIYGYFQMNALRALRWCTRHKVPALLNSDSENLQARSMPRLMAKSVIVSAIYRRFSAFLSVGDNNEAYYKKYGAPADRIFRTPFTIDEARYLDARNNRAELRSDFRKEQAINDDVRLVLFVGKLSDRKRPEDLIEAVHLLNSRSSPVRYEAVFAGNGELLEGMKAKVQREGIAARFLGFVNVDALPQVYAASDILAHPSMADPHPLICSEAACIGMPMVLSDRIGAVGPTDVARRDENASIFKCADISDFAATLAQVGDSKSVCAAMGARSLEIYEDVNLKQSVAGIKAAMTAVGALKS